MDGSKKVGSSSSITAEIFGPKEESPPSSSASFFASIFRPPSGVVTGTQASHNKKGIPGTSNGDVYENVPGKSKSSVFHEDAGAYENLPSKYRSSTFHGYRAEPCHLSSSLFYGGQDIYPQSSSSPNAGSYQNLKDCGEDDPNGNNSNAASRGNWWQGSLYY